MDMSKSYFMVLKEVCLFQLVDNFRFITVAKFTKHVEI
jgi:hypothetical protein